MNLSPVLPSALTPFIEEASVAQWFCHLHCKLGVVGSILGFSSLSDETTKQGPDLHMTIAVGRTLNLTSTNQPFIQETTLIALIMNYYSNGQF